jgi:lysophospholipase L1-like esterase
LLKIKILSMYKLFVIFLLCTVTPVLYAQNDTILIDFGTNLSPVPWNNVTSSSSGLINNLTNSNGFSTTIDINVFDSFAGINNSGTIIPDTNLNIHANASADSFFGNMVSFNGNTVPTAGVELTDLDTSEVYDLTLFASRIATDNRETRYIVVGEVTDTLYLNVSSNTSSVVSASMKPDSTGRLAISLTAGSNNDNGYGFFYLGAITLSYAHVSPGPQELTLMSPNGGEVWQSNKMPSIQWQSDNISSLIIEYSIDNGSSWTVIDTVSAAQTSYPWLVPIVSSTTCLMKLSSDSLTVESAATFEITEDTTTCTIVVLGSSTAEGAGTSVLDSAWVYRYQNELFQNNTKYEVINLGKGGYTTYHILPTGSALPVGITTTIDVDRNMTKALSYNPYAIIVNMPSNDAANNYSVQQQLDNFKTLSDSANANDAEIWICTTQPRNFSNASQIQIQEDTRDSVLAIYGSHAIDFWNGFAATNGFIESAYDTGDGVHMNDLGHFNLFTRVMAKNIQEINCSGVDTTNEIIQNEFNSQLTYYPNPFTTNVTLKVDVIHNSNAVLQLYDSQGHLISIENYELAVGTNEIKVKTLNQKEVKGNLFFGRVTISNEIENQTFTFKLIKQ